MKSSMSASVAGFVTVSATIGTGVLAVALLHFHSDDPLKFLCYLAIAVLASTLKVRLPGMESTMSVHFLFVLLGVLELSLGETLLLGCAATLIQSVWKTKNRPEFIKVAFNVLGMAAPAIFLTYKAYNSWGVHNARSIPVLLLIAACTYFVANTLPVSIVIALSTNTSFRKIWSETFFWSLPYYLVGAVLVGVISWVDHFIGWQSALLAMPLMYWVYRSYHLYLSRLEEEKTLVETKALQLEAEKRHVEELCALHLRTIEGLALAIEAKDHNTHSHLHRVRTYALEIGKELHLDKDDLDALRAAALLHDIGKLAVLDHIINKPGRLTPEEFEKMKIHSAVGAEILERVSFPYPVAPIVRGHHERWDGMGYPDRLRGQEIPIGARILSVVDSLDALTSDRQYRKALSLETAMQTILDETGKAYDPAVVEVLQRRLTDLEALVARKLDEASTDALRFVHHAGQSESPANGLVHGVQGPANQTDFLASIASARQEAHTLFELSQDLGNSLSLDETLSLVALRLRKLIPYESLVVFVQANDMLRPEFVTGECAGLFSSLRIPVGTGLCGWVAQNVRPIINGNPDVESGFAQGSSAEGGGLRSALAVPLEGLTGPVGVMALYRSEVDTFASEDLRILQVVTARVAHFIENALRYREAENSATVDYLTDMANARALSVYLQAEIERCEREGAGLTIMVSDLDGFKEINDRFGHLAGDKVLKRFAQLARETCGDDAYIARMGGDEFVIVAPQLPAGAVSMLAEALSLRAQQAGVELCGIRTLALSVGASFYPLDGVDAEKLLSEADKRMYSMKSIHHEGRGRAEVPATEPQAAALTQ